MEVNVAPCQTVKTRAQVITVQFSPFEWSSGLLAVALPSSVAVYSLKFKDEGEGIEDCSHLWEWHLSSQPICIAWSPNATLRANPRCLQLSVASANNTVTQLSSDLGDSNVAQDIISHKDFINSVTYNGESGSLVASTGDDLTALVWNSATNNVFAKFFLSSPGMVVRFHPEDPDLLLVGEKTGVLRVYSIDRGCSTLFLRCPGPLLDADWSIPDPALLVAAGAKGLTVWNVASPQPCNELVEVGGGERVYDVEVCRSTPGLVATHSSPHTIRVTHLHSSKVPIAVHLKIVGGLSWHQNYPYLVVGSDRQIFFWKINNV